MNSLSFRAAEPSALGQIELTVVVPCYNERPNVRPLVEKLHAALNGIEWEVVYVDDDSPDGTTAELRKVAEADRRVRCIRRIGRRGLASAVIEGAMSSSARYVAVLDGDLQHDETRLPDMLAALRGGDFDIAVGSRHVEGGDTTGLSSRWRHMLSDGGIRLAQAFLPVKLADPMSGFFMLPRETFETLAPLLTGKGFKILLDLVMSAPAKLRVAEIPCRFLPRVAGASKLDVLVLAQFAGLLLDKVFAGLLPMRFLAFCLVGGLGVGLHLAVLTAAHGIAGVGFGQAQITATIVAMVFNFWLNNSLTYRDTRLRGPMLWRGLLLFILVCGLGAIANVGIARMLYDTNGSGWNVAGATGAIIGVVWNYAVSATLVWRTR